MPDFNKPNHAGKLSAGKRTLFDRAFDRFVDWVERRIVTHSVFGNPPIYDKTLFPWVAEVEKDWQGIRKELDAVMLRRDELPSFHEISKDVATITTDDQWKTFFFESYGIKCTESVEQCPQTARALAKIPGLTTAMFSILSPGKRIPPHRGPYNGVLRFHLGLIVPKDRDKVKIRVDEAFYHWAEGEGVVFDDSFDHEVWNDTDEIRVVLFVDFLRPQRGFGKFLNGLMLWIAKYTPYLKEAEQNYKVWAEKFYGQKGGAANMPGGSDAAQKGSAVAGVK